MKKSKRTLPQKLGLLGVVSFLSYAAAVVFAPLAYPGYDWMAQAVSDLSAANAPSLALWNQLTALYNACEVVCVTVVCIGIQGRKSKLLRSGIYLFAIMEWVSAVGYRMFPLSDSGYAGAFQDGMHMVTTALVVLLSIVSLTVIIAAGVKSRDTPHLFPNWPSPMQRRLPLWARPTHGNREFQQLRLCCQLFGFFQSVGRLGSYGLHFQQHFHGVIG